LIQQVKLTPPGDVVLKHCRFDQLRERGSVAAGCQSVLWWFSGAGFDPQP
jgi:hypothetical protein